jgi:16S rRNA (guanine966-N2)-methyltransferase
MRVIAGKAKGRQLRSVPGSGTRPITDRVKEALFSITGADVVESSWWDVFAGTGAVGIEALSRGARYVRLTDLDRAAIETIKTNLTTTGLSAGAEARRADAFTLLSSAPDRQFDYVYIAPPQYKGLWLRALTCLDSNVGWLSADGWAIIQVDPKEYQGEQVDRLEKFDQRRYGTTQLLFFVQKPA